MTPSLDGLDLPPLPGRWLQLSRTYTAFPDVPTRWILDHRLLVQVTADRGIYLCDTTNFPLHRDPRLGYRYSLGYEVADLFLYGGDEGVALARSVADGRATLGILADWAEDDPHRRVKSAHLPWDWGHRTCEDAVAHMLTVMRCHRPAKRRAR